MKEAKDIRIARERLGLSQSQLAEIAGVGRVHLAMVENGTRPLTTKFATRIFAVLEEIETKRDGVLSGATSPPVSPPAPSPPELLRVKREIPVVGMAAAAMYDPALSQICDLWEGSSETVPCAIEREGIFALRIQGDSMEPALHDGDVVAVDPNALPATGDVAVVCLRAEGLVVKRWHWRRGVIRLESLNPEGKTYEWTKEEVFQKGLILWRWKVLGLLWHKF